MFLISLVLISYFKDIQTVWNVMIDSWDSLLIGRVGTGGISVPQLHFCKDSKLPRKHKMEAFSSGMF